MDAELNAEGGLAECPLQHCDLPKSGAPRKAQIYSRHWASISVYQVLSQPTQFTVTCSEVWTTRTAVAQHTTSAYENKSTIFLFFFFSPWSVISALARNVRFNLLAKLSDI